ncbi:Bud site selection protein 6 [Ascosphaera aggregata]|nr:Bud site selection protein 6 [Ascosphaera aggregata]
MTQTPAAASPEPALRATSYQEPGVIRQTASAERHGGSFAEREASRREVGPRLGGTSSPQSSMQNITATIPSATYQDGRPRFSPQTPFPHPPLPPPPPPPPPTKQNDAIGLLQRSGELERRASRRFSAYQIQKHLGTPPSGMPVLPTQQPPLPTRGREVRESMNAVRLRGSYLSRQKAVPDSSRRDLDQLRDDDSRNPRPTPASSTAAAGTAAATTPANTSTPRMRPSLGKEASAERLRLTESGSPASGGGGGAAAAAGATLAELMRKTGPISPRDDSLDYTPGTPRINGFVEPTHPTGPHQYSGDASLPPPSPGSKELTLFLQYKHKIKKYVLPEGYAGLTLGRLQLAFIEKFAWNTHNNGADLPDIYVQDQTSGVRHELEDLADVKDRSVLVLNIEPLDEVKKHFDEQVGGVKSLLEGMQNLIETQSSSIQQMNDHQQTASKELARLAIPFPGSEHGSSSKRTSLALASSGAAASADTDEPRPSVPTSAGAAEIAEIRSVRRDLAVLRQIYTSFTSDINNSMKMIRKKAEGVKSIAVETSTPGYEGDAGRAHINAGKKTLADESEKLVARVDDLQDLVEDLRKDVVSRGVRPLPRQLEAVGRDIAAVTKELKKMQEFLKKEKPIWTKIWEKELQLVCEERDQLTMQEDLAVDLEDDLEKAAQTFALVEQATKQQNSQTNSNSVVGTRSMSRGLPVDPVTDLAKIKDSVLGEVKALQPNHQNRLDAIERAEKARQKELEDRRVGKFQKELGNFVQEGRLKKSGGIDETERMRKAKDEQIRKEAWEAEVARKEELNAVSNLNTPSNANFSREEGVEDHPGTPETPKEEEHPTTSTSDEAATAAEGPELVQKSEQVEHREDQEMDGNQKHIHDRIEEEEDASAPSAAADA